MVRPEIIRKRLNKLDEYLDIVYDVLHEGLDDIGEIKKKLAVYM